MLVTKREIKFSGVIFMGTLLGSVFGLMEITASLMGWVEEIIDIIKKRNPAKVLPLQSSSFNSCLSEKQNIELTQVA